MSVSPSVWALAAEYWDPPDSDDGAASDRELALRCSKDLRLFIREAWPLLEPARPFVPAWHIDCVAEHLMAVSAGEIKLLAVNMPPGSTKSSTIAIMWPAWEWMLKPHLRWIVASYGDKFAMRDSRKMRGLIETRSGDRQDGGLFERRGYQGVLGLLGQAWGLAADQNAKGRYDTTAGGMRLATSIEGQVTGDHGDRLVIDDPLNPKMARSTAHREGVNAWWEETMKARFIDKKATAVMVQQRLHECLLPQSLILTGAGTVRADTIAVGDAVLTSRGQQKVIATHERHHRGPAVGVRAYGHAESLWVTPEHPLLTIDGWKPAGEVSIADTLVFPVPAGVTSPAELRALWPAAPVGRTPKQHHTVTGARRRVDECKLRELVGQGLSSRAIGERLGKSRATVDSYITVYGIQRLPFRAVDPAALEDPDFWWLVGLWLAEGSLGKGRDGGYERVRITLSRGESAFVDRVSEIMGRYGIPVTVYEEPSVLQASFASKQVALFLAEFGVGAHGKHLPQWAARLELAFLRELYRGWFDGDGCVNARGEVRGTSVSIGLVSGFQQALLRLGIVASVMAAGKGGPGQIGAQKFVSGPSYELRFPSCDAPWLGATAADGSLLVPRYRQNKLDGQRLLVGVKAVETDTYDGLVYDIETPAGDFLCGLITAHNCDLTGHLLGKNAGWHHLCLPAEYVPAHPFTYPAKVRLPSGRVIDGDPRTEPGELLDPGRLGEEMLAPQRANSFVFAGQYQQQPAPEGGGLFKRDWLTRRWTPDQIPRLEHGMDRFVQSWDMAFKATSSSDYVVGQLWGFHGADCYLLAQIRGRLDFTATLHAVRALSDFEPRATAKLVEDKANGTAVINTLRRSVTGLIAIEPQGGKLVRASAVSPRLEAGNVILPAADTIPCPDGYTDKQGAWHAFVPTTVADWIHEITTFPAGAHDDQTDAMTQALTRANPQDPGPREPVPPGPRPPGSIMGGVMDITF